MALLDCVDVVQRRVADRDPAVLRAQVQALCEEVGQPVTAPEVKAAVDLYLGQTPPAVAMAAPTHPAAKATPPRSNAIDELPAVHHREERRLEQAIEKERARLVAAQREEDVDPGTFLGFVSILSALAAFLCLAMKVMSLAVDPSTPMAHLAWGQWALMGLGTTVVAMGADRGLERLFRRRKVAACQRVLDDLLRQRVRVIEHLGAPCIPGLLCGA